MNTPIKANFDLMKSVAESAGAKFHKAGKGFSSHCPIHGGKNPNAFSIYRAADGVAMYHCFTRANCGSGDVIKLVMNLDNCDYKTALEKLGGDTYKPDPNRPRPSPPPIHPDTPPSPAWQTQAWKLIERAQDVLWSNDGKEALSYLLMRGLDEKTIATAQLGYIPKDYKQDSKTWGTPNDEQNPMYFFKGILIPGIVGAHVWYFKMRQEDHPDMQKYIQVRGSKPALYGADTLTKRPAALCEGEFDKLLLFQEAGDLVDVVTMGSSTNEINLATWGLYLMRPSCFVLAYDTDEAGDKGADKLTWLHDAHRLHIPTIQQGDKDLTDYYLHGNDLNGLHGNLHKLIQNALQYAETIKHPAQA